MGGFGGDVVSCDRSLQPLVHLQKSASSLAAVLQALTLIRRLARARQIGPSDARKIRSH